MKRICLLSAFILGINFNGLAQIVNNLVVFCNDGEPFTLILNGAQQNQVPLTRIVVQNLDLPEYQVKIIFKNPKIRNTDTKLTFYRTGKECEFALNKRGSKKYTMDYFTERPIPGFVDASVQAPAQQDLTNAAPVINTGTLADTPAPVAADQATIAAVPPVSTVPPPITGCSGILSPQDLSSYKSSMMQQATDALRQSTINSLLQNSCLLTSQVKELMGAFSTEQAKLAFAKYAYPRTQDLENYVRLLDNFMSLQDEFKKLTKSK